MGRGCCWPAAGCCCLTCDVLLVQRSNYDGCVGGDARGAAIARFQKSCLYDPSIVAAFLGGSLAGGSADQVSDVDIYAVTRESNYPAFFARRQAFMESWARPVFLADTVDFEGLGFDMLHFVLVDGVHGELALGHTQNFRRLHGGPHKVLVDKIGLLPGVTFARVVPSETQLRRQAEHALGWFWLDCLQLDKHVVRGNSIAAAADLAQLRSRCTILLHIARTAGLATDASRFRHRLEQIIAADDLEDVRGAALAVAELHRDLGMLVGERFGLAYPAELAAVVRPSLDGSARSSPLS